MTNSAKYIIALDVGDRRIGVAIASTIARLPSPLLTIDRLNGDALARVIEIAKDHEAAAIVVGLPRDMSGNETAQTAKVQTFVAELQKLTPVPLVMQDEAVTSIDAEARLKRSGKSYTKADIDAEAACIILQDYLNSQIARTA